MHTLMKCAKYVVTVCHKSDMTKQYILLWISFCQEFSELWPKLDAIFDGGRLSDSTHNKTGSTVVDLSKTGLFTVIRDGW